MEKIVKGFVEGPTGVNGYLKLHVTTLAGREDDFSFQLVTRPG